jgi:hypothetical protein
MSANDPKRTFAGAQPNHLRSAGLTRYHALFRALGEAMRQVRGLRRVSYRSVMTAMALAIMLGAIVTVTGVAWHGLGRWY